MKEYLPTPMQTLFILFGCILVITFPFYPVNDGLDYTSHLSISPSKTNKM